MVTNLGVTGAQSAIQTAETTWDDRTIFAFTNLGYWDISGNIVTTRNFATSPACIGNTTAAVVCLTANPNTISKTQLYYNTSGKYSWNTSGVVSYSAPERRDVQTTSTHEFGHWFFLDHSNVSGSTMNLSNRSISEDDKQGVTQLYGPYTGFDNGRASGISNYTTYSARVTGYDGSGAPTLFVVNSGNDAVPSYFGTSMLRIAGSATSGLSYVYFKLFSIDRDTGTSKRGVTISSGARLKWCQYNAQQTTMSIDANFTDGTSLREYQVVDQNGVRVHPAYRSNGPINIWTCYDADLTPVVGKQVRHWYVAYDNSLTQIGGPFRGYIDSLKLIWPGGKP